MKDGMKDGKWIVYRSDGDYLHMEFSQGQKHGRFRWCTRHGTILDESLLANGKHLASDATKATIEAVQAAIVAAAIVPAVVASVASN